MNSPERAVADPRSELATIEYQSRHDDREVFSAQAIKDGEVVGVIEARTREFPYDRQSIYRYAEITNLTVAAHQRRRGIASHLLHLTLAWAARHNYQRLAVEASAKPDAPGPAFYDATGFTARSISFDIEIPSGTRT